MLDDHHIGAKSIFLEGAAHIPLLVRPPAGSRDSKPLAGTRVDSLVNLADILPTVLNIADVPLPSGIDGTDLMAVADTCPDREFYGVYKNEFHCLIRGSYKYTWASAGGEELFFNLEKDPMEQRNLAGSDEDADLLNSMRDELIQRMKAHNSPCVENGQLKPGPPVEDPGSVPKWPGFHSTVFDKVDVLH